MARVRRGKASVRSDAELTLESAVGPDDLESARIAWRRDAPPGFRDLVDAERWDLRDRPV